MGGREGRGARDEREGRERGRQVPRGKRLSLRGKGEVDWFVVGEEGGVGGGRWIMDGGEREGRLAGRHSLAGFVRLTIA